jgi:hypothetical protein
MKTRHLFQKENEERKANGLKPIMWVEFIRGTKPNRIGGKRKEPVGPKQIPRPPAVYDNKSPYDKYGV